MWSLFPKVIGTLFALLLATKLRKKKPTAPPTLREMGLGLPRTFQGVPFAQGTPWPAFPVAASSDHPKRGVVSYKDTDGKWYGDPSWAFGASRPGSSGKRWHAAIDLWANHGDVVVAPEGGTIVATQNFLDTIDGSGHDAMLIEGDSGVTVLLGEIDEKAFGLRVGDRVTRGQPVARVQETTNGSHLLHFETYRAGRKSNQSWRQGAPAPSHLLDPTDYLLRAKAAEQPNA